MKKLFTLLTLLVVCVTGAWGADLCYVDFSGLTIDSNNKTGSKNGTNCTMTYSVDGESYTFSNVKYYKFGSGSNVNIKLTSGSFEAGDVLSVKLGNNASGSKTLGFGLKSVTDTKTASVGKTSTTTMSYTLKATDINDDGSITIYRSNSNGSSARYFSFSVTGDRGPSIGTTGTTSVTATESGVAATTNISITGKKLTASGTLTAEFTSSVSGLSVSFGANTTSISASGDITTAVTVSYESTVNVPASTATLRISDGTTTKDIIITYYASVASWTLQTISTAKTWDFSQDVSGGKQYTTAEEKNTEFVYANISELSYSGSFDATALAFKGEYPFRDNSHKYAQNGVLRFNTTVPGTINVRFSDTGSSASATAVKRYLVVNDEQTEYWASRENNGTENPYPAQQNVTTGEISVPAGDVTIKGSSAIIVSYLSFTPAAASVSVGPKGFATYCNADYALDFTGKSIEAYTVSSNGASLTLTKKQKVAKGEPVLLYSKTASDSQMIPAIAESEATADNTNKLVAGNDSPITWTDNNHVYILYTGGATPGFYRANNSTVAANKAYLNLGAAGARAVSFILNMDDSITAISEVATEVGDESACAPVYDLQGRRVAQPAKGLYIVNGKKVIIK